MKLFELFGQKQINRLARNSKRFVEMMGVSSTQEKAELCDVICHLITNHKQKDVYFMYSNKELIFKMNNSNHKQYTVPSGKEDVVLFFNGYKISETTKDNYLNQESSSSSGFLLGSLSNNNNNNNNNNNG